MTKNNKKFIAKFRSYFFEAYYLNKFRNFLEPLECTEKDCPKYGTDECDDDVYLQVESIDDVIAMAFENLDLCDAKDAAIFVHCYNEEMFAVVKSPQIEEDNKIIQTQDGINVTIFHSSNFDKTLFAEIDAEYELACYGLLIEKEPNFWKVVGD